MTLLIQTTIPDPKIGGQLSQLLLEKKWAASVQLSGPITSSYWWQDQIEKKQEWVLSIRTLKTNYEKIENLIRKHHPYDLPEIFAIDMVKAPKEYLEWIEKYAKGDS